MSRRGLFTSTSSSATSFSADIVAGQVLSSISSSSASLNDESALDGTPASVPQMMDSQKLYKGFLDGQKRIAELEQQIKVLTAENADLKLHLASLSRRRRGNGGTKASDLKKASESDLASTNLVDILHKLGRHFQLFWCILVDVAQFSRENCPEWSWDDYQTRFSSQDQQKQGPTAELYSVVPAEFHDLMALAGKTDSGKNFVKEVWTFLMLPVTDYLIIAF
jgi:hypothetical protein